MVWWGGGGGVGSGSGGGGGMSRWLPEDWQAEMRWRSVVVSVMVFAMVVYIYHGSDFVLELHGQLLPDASEGDPGLGTRYASASRASRRCNGTHRRWLCHL